MRNNQYLLKAGSFACGAAITIFCAVLSSCSAKPPEEANDMTSASSVDSVLVLVRDAKNGAPVPGATVAMMSGSTSRSGVTTSNGVVTLNPLSSPQVTVEASASGFQRASQSVDLSLALASSNMPSVLVLLDRVVLQ